MCVHRNTQFMCVILCTHKQNHTQSATFHLFPYVPDYPGQSYLDLTQEKQPKVSRPINAEASAAPVLWWVLESCEEPAWK